MKSWKETDAIVLKTSLDYRAGRGGENWRHKIQYRYIVNGQSFENDKVYFGRIFTLYKNAREAASHLPKIQGKIKILFNPSDPTDSVIYVGRISKTEFYVVTAFSIISAIFSGIVGFLAIIVWRKELHPSWTGFRVLRAKPK